MYFLAKMNGTDMLCEMQSEGKTAVAPRYGAFMVTPPFMNGPDVFTQATPLPKLHAASRELAAVISSAFMNGPNMAILA